MKLGEAFSSRMVFAQNKPIRIFGVGDGEATVTFNGISKKVISKDSFWLVEFPSMEYGGPYELTFVSDEENKTLDDIYVGEVFLFAGQSNMALHLDETNTPYKLWEDNEKLHYLSVKPRSQDMSWQTAKRDEVGAWSALGYLASREVAFQRDIHVGIILCATGASVIESWMPAGALGFIGISIPLNEKFEDHYSERYSSWNHDGYLYNSKLTRIIPFSLSGAIWYQGESDDSVTEAKVYEEELRELIRIWRKDFRNENMPFIIVQLADCKGRINKDPAWRMIQDAQERISSYLPHTYTVMCKDICETDDIHPKTKDKLALRIAELIKKRFI